MKCFELNYRFILVFSFILCTILLLILSDQSNYIDLFVSFLISFIVSAVFYFIVVYIPEKEKSLKPYIAYKTENIIFSLSIIFKTLTKESGYNYNFQKLSKKELNNCCKKIEKPFPKKFAFYTGEVDNIYMGDIGNRLISSWLKASRYCDELLETAFQTDSILSSYLLKIFKNSTMLIMVNDLKSLKHVDNLLPFNNAFSELYIELKNLRDYYCKKYNTDFPNDPWKN